jgi:signal peptidase II
MSRRRRLVLLAVLLVVTLVCDQLTKHAARLLLLPGIESPVIPGFFSLELAENQGAFLSLGAGLPQVLRLVLSAAVVVLLLALAVAVLRDTGSSFPTLLGAALLVAGGCSNFVDRLRFQGRVTDFLFLRAGPLHTGVFNVADVAIMAGAVLLAWASFRVRASLPDPGHDSRGTPG